MPLYLNVNVHDVRHIITRIDKGKIDDAETILRDECDNESILMYRLGLITGKLYGLNNLAIFLKRFNIELNYNESP